MNRAVGRRPLFEGEADIRNFINCLVSSVKRQEIRIQAFTFLTTHFHLLLESVAGRLGAALRRIESEYVSRFNRRHDRDGPLVRGRFLSKIVDHDAYWARIVRYIDDNPVAAGLTTDPSRYPHGSAAHYVLPEGPHWLHRDPVERFVSARRGGKAYDGADYRAVFHSGLSQTEREWVESRVRRGDRYDDPFADLIGAAPKVVREWLVERARIADGMRPGIPVVDVGTVQAAVAATRASSATWQVGMGRQGRDGWVVLLVGLLRSLCAESFESIGRRLGEPQSTAYSQFQRHAALILADAAYGMQVELVAGTALRTFAATVENGVPFGGEGRFESRWNGRDPDLRNSME